MVSQEEVKEVVLKEKLKKFPTVIQNLIIIGNYIERIKKIKPAPLRLYYFYYKYFENSSEIKLEEIVHLIMIYKKVWFLSKRLGYVYLNREYYLPLDFVKNHLKSKAPLGLEDIEYLKWVLNYINTELLSVFLQIVKDPSVVKNNKKHKSIKDVVEKLSKLGLIENSTNLRLTNKGWKLFYILKDLLDLIGEKHLLKELGI